ncbi:hypothetical protein KDE12_03595 [Campylobacter sp. faydin G-105]|uniref:YajG family lipoprotein n=1 Tax=Campylobacter anatolicus TaxID=2829105 RepID=UPI001B949645|nr:YajG family lipoprotein [Campylobacter anatolicus]MBR8461936.1 hypothetical protein [Campylobacter anatolicus]
MRNLKFIIVFIFVAIFSGCSPTQSVLNLDPYKTSIISSKSSKDVFIKNIYDNRKNKSTVATITDSKGGVDEYVVLQNDISSWFKTSLESELKSRGANIGSMGGVVIDVYINELGANMSGYSQDNMKGNIKITLKITKGEQNIIKNIADNQSKFQLIRTGGAFKPFLQDMLNDTIRRCAEQILNN